MATQQPVPGGSRKAALLRWIVGAAVIAAVAIPLTIANMSASQTAGARPAGPAAGAAPALHGATPPPVTKQPAAEPAPPVALPPVALTKKVAPVPGVVFSISPLEAVEGIAQGPGEIAGPALRFTLAVRNDTAKPVSLALAVVNVYAGTERAPATELRKPGGVPLPGRVASGATATGVFVFSVPDDLRDQVQVAVDFAVGAPIVVFQGTAPR
jgi:hypothetical protein